MNRFVQDFLIQRNGVPVHGRWRKTRLSPIFDALPDYEAVKHGLSLKLEIIENSEEIQECPAYRLSWAVHEQPDGRLKDFLLAEGVPKVLSLRDFPLFTKRPVMFRISERIADHLTHYCGYLYQRHILETFKDERFFRYLLAILKHPICWQIAYGIPCPICLEVI